MEAPNWNGRLRRTLPTETAAGDDRRWEAAGAVVTRKLATKVRYSLKSCPERWSGRSATGRDAQAFQGLSCSALNELTVEVL